MKTSAFCLLLIFMGIEPCLAEGVGASWFKGELHAHSYWSDGRAFPEQALQAYQQRGYHFVSLTEHNRFADDPAQWRKVEDTEGEWPPNVTRTMFDALVRDLGKDGVDSRTEGDTTSVLLRTYSELKRRFEVPGKFLLLPGVEITQELRGLSPHLNYINLPSLIPSLRNANLIERLDNPDMTVSKLIALNASEVSALEAELQRPSLLMVNHPFYNIDILPQDLIENPKLRFFEVYNTGTEIFPGAPSYTIEKFWDAINAFRCVNGQSLLYGVASDDAHFYDPGRIEGYAGVDLGWVMVRAASLSPEAVLHAMNDGDFYSTMGVYLDEVAFNQKENALHVKVKPEEGVNYRICFITTKADFDRSVSWVEIAKPPRKIPLYSEEIGREVAASSGMEASYTLEPDDLYVRARVESDKPSKLAGDPKHAGLQPKTQTAWTQPYANAFRK